MRNVLVDSAKRVRITAESSDVPNNGKGTLLDAWMENFPDANHPDYPTYTQSRTNEFLNSS